MSCLSTILIINIYLPTAGGVVVVLLGLWGLESTKRTPDWSKESSSKIDSSTAKAKPVLGSSGTSTESKVRYIKEGTVIIGV